MRQKFFGTSVVASIDECLNLATEFCDINDTKRQIVRISA